MADHSDRPDDDWADGVAKWTFISTVILAVLYCGAVFVFILR
jgi:hypothetical protein